MENYSSEHFIRLEKNLKKDDIEGKVFSFDDPEQNKSTPIRINKINRILGSGSYSKWVAEVNVELENDTNKEKRTHNMVVKRYAEKKIAGVATDLKKSYENFKTIQKAGIPTWDTYRINETHQLVLMTLGVKENEILITATDFDDNPNRKIFKENPVKKITNLDEFINKVALILEKEDIYGFRLHSDSFGIVFKPQKDAGDYEINIVVSDLDSLDKSTDDVYVSHYGSDIKERWKVENKATINTALWCIFPGSDTQKEVFRKSVMSKI